MEFRELTSDELNLLGESPDSTQYRELTSKELSGIPGYDPYGIEPLLPEDFGSGGVRAGVRPNVVFSETREMTEPFRSLIGATPVSDWAVRSGVPKGVASLSVIPDIAVSGLGLLGTGLAGGLSIIPELYGLGKQITSGGISPTEKRQLGRGIMGMLESTSGSMTGAIAPFSTGRKISQYPQSVAAREASELGIIPPATHIGPTTSSLARVLEEVPIVGAPLQAEKARIASETGRVVEKISPTPKATKYETGTRLSRGIEEFAETTKVKQQELYNKADELIPPDMPTTAPNTVEYLNSVADMYAGFRSAARETGNQKILSFLDDLEKITPVGKVVKELEATGDVQAIRALESLGVAVDDVASLTPQKFETLKNLRSAIGEALGDSASPLAQGIGRGNLNQLYKALSRDIDEAATAVGPEAAQAYNRANTYFKARQERIKGAIDDIAKTDDPEQALRVVTNIIKSGSAKESQNSLIKLQKSLGKDEFQEVSQQIIGNMGRLDDVAEGGVNFVPSKFISEWQKLSPKAQEILTNSAGGAGAFDEMKKLTRFISKSESATGPSGQSLYRWRRALTAIGLFTAAASGGGGVLATTAVAVTPPILTSERFLKAVNRMAINDLGPIRVLANSTDASAPAAKMALQIYSEE